MAKRIYGIGMDGSPLRTQASAIRSYMKETGNKVSQKFVTDKWGFTRLSAIIYIIKDDLARENKGEYIADRFVSCTNRFGNPTHYKEYWIESSTNDEE